MKREQSIAPRQWRFVMQALLPMAAFMTLAMMASLTVGHRPVSAGETYQNGFPADGDFFPIGVWLQSPLNAPKYRAMGINTFVGLWKGPTEPQLAELARDGMLVVAEQNEIGLNSVNRNVIKAWMQSDEPDDAQATGLGIYGPCIPAAEAVRRSRALKARDGTRPVLINFGPGVADKSWPGRGSCTGDLEYYDVAVEAADILSFDIYPVGSKSPSVKGNLEYVAYGVTNLVKRARHGQTVWAILETTAFDPQRPVMPAEVRTEVWMALIHGARGIVYFVHEFAPSFREDAIFRHPDVVEEVAKVNQTIKALAPVLNSPDVFGKVAISSPVPIATMAKQYDDALYIFAVAMRNDASTPWFAIRDIRNATAIVLGEDRTESIKDGILEDSFPGYGIHLYKIPLAHGGSNGTVN